MEQATITYENELKNFVTSLILDIMAISDTGLKEKKGKILMKILES